MARFSVKERDGAAEGESSRRGRKRTKVVTDKEVVMEEGGDEVGNGNDEVENGEPAVIEEQADDSNDDADTKEGSISVILTDTEVLDCIICYEPLKIPVYQCENGHIACASCCTKIKNKCPSCAFPIGYSRCRAIEKVIESMKVLCRNSRYGCHKRLSFSERKVHEDRCVHKPYTCPVAGCCFKGSCHHLWQHCSVTHSIWVKRFQYNQLLSFMLDECSKYVILIEEKEDAVFVLKATSESYGKMLTVKALCPIVPEKVVSYDLTARQDVSTLRLQSLMLEYAFESYESTSSFLLVPRGYFDSNKQLRVELYIRYSNLR